ncbi:MAG: FecR domain-containing protein, partial [Deltaproteobacteria bacterium]|nr:FecR domain-containing protein [Deltaproteobacteria bacterium]
MKKTFVTSMIAVALFFLLPALVWAAVVGKFTFVKGRVDLSRAGRQAVIVRLGDKVEAGDVIRSKSKSVAEVTFVNKNIMRISSGSKVTLTKYTIGDSPNAIIDLSRGKVQNIVNKASLSLSRLRKRKFEVHTPTMVVGVRGTNFLTSYRFGVSFASFKRGYGYGFNKRRPNQVFNIPTGQLIEVSSPTAIPIVRKATPAELSSPELEQAGMDKSKEGGGTAGGKSGKKGEKKADKDKNKNGGKPGKAAKSKNGNAVVGDIAGDYDVAPAVDASAHQNVGTDDSSKTTAPSITDSQDNIAAVAAVVKKDPTLKSTASVDTLTALVDNPDEIKAALASDYNPGFDPNSPQYNPVLDPNSSSYDPTLDPNNQNYNPQPAPTPYASNSSFAWVPGIGHHGELWRLDGSNKRRFEYDYFQVSASADIAAGTIPFASRIYEYNDGINKDKSMMYLPFGEEWYMMDFDPGDFSPLISSSPWDATSSSDPTTFTAPQDGASWSDLPGNFDTRSTNAAVKSGTASVSMGALAAVTGSYGQNPLTFTGTYVPADNNYSRRVLVDLSLQSPAGSPVGYEGFFAGILDSSTLNTALIYVDPNGRVGTLTGTVDAAASLTSSWSTTATLSDDQHPGTVGFSPDQLAANLDSGLMWGELHGYSGSYYNNSTGNFNDQVIYGSGAGRTLNIKDLDWGIFRLLFGYDAVNNSSSLSYWDAEISGKGEFGSHVTNTGQKPNFGIWAAWSYFDSTNSGTNNGDFGGSYFSGQFITPSNSGWISGDLSAAYDINSTANGAWMGAAAGEWSKGADFMFNGILNGTAHSHAESIKSYRQTNYGRTAIITDGTAAMYEYSAVKGENQGTSWYYDNTNNTITRRDYHPDNTYDEMTFTPAGGFTYGANGFLGNYSASGSYSRSAPQSYTGTALSNLSSLPTGLTSLDTQTINSGFNDIGSFQDGLLGGIYQDLLAAGTTQANPASFDGLLDADIWGGGAGGGSVYVAGINSYNPYDGSYTIMNPADNSHNGSYWGYLAMGTANNINSQNYYYGYGDYLSGFIGGLYIDKQGNAGVVKGNFNTNNYYGGGGAAGIHGEMFPVALIPASFTAVT